MKFELEIGIQPHDEQKLRKVLEDFCYKQFIRQHVLRQTDCSTQLPGWAIELLAEVRQRLLVDLDEDGEPRSSMAELMAMWDKMNEVLNLKTIGQLS